MLFGRGIFPMAKCMLGHVLVTIGGWGVCCTIGAAGTGGGERAGIEGVIGWVKATAASTATANAAIYGLRTAKWTTPETLPSPGTADNILVCSPFFRIDAMRRRY